MLPFAVTTQLYYCGISSGYSFSLPVVFVYYNACFCQRLYTTVGLMLYLILFSLYNYAYYFYLFLQGVPLCPSKSQVPLWVYTSFSLSHLQNNEDLKLFGLCECVMDTSTSLSHTYYDEYIPRHILTIYRSLFLSTVSLWVSWKYPVSP